MYTQLVSTIKNLHRLIWQCWLTVIILNADSCHIGINRDVGKGGAHYTEDGLKGFYPLSKNIISNRNVDQNISHTLVKPQHHADVFTEEKLFPKQPTIFLKQINV